MTARDRTNQFGFSLFELLVVIVLIATLAAILVPALSRARKTGRTAVCMFNQRTLAQAVHAFAADHRGFGQIMIDGNSSHRISKRPDQYEYEPSEPVWKNLQFRARVVPSPWPVAYADYYGSPGLKSEEFVTFEGSGSDISGDPGRRGTSGGDTGSQLGAKTVPVLQCPSDNAPCGFIERPGFAWVAISYAVNLDLFGSVHERGNGIRPWREGAPLTGVGLEGRLDRVVRPQRVLLFADARSGEAKAANQPRFVTTGLVPSNASDLMGPTLSAFNHRINVLPPRRHSNAGRVVTAYVDGHAQSLRPIDSVSDELGAGQDPVRYSPDPRISPYEPYGHKREARHGTARGR